MIRAERTIGNCRLILGDCREVLPTLTGVDAGWALVTDPPYGIGHKHSGKSSASSKWTKANSSAIYMDDHPFDPAPFLQLKTAMFGADHFASLLPTGGIFHVWDKECARSGRFDSFSDAEILWTSWPGKRRVFRYLWKGLQVEHPVVDGVRLHPTQKPVELMEAILEMTDAVSILDPFMGSGTTGVACARLGRRFIGIEIHEPYYEIACRRIEQACRQPDMFVTPVPEDPELVHQADLWLEPGK